MFFVYRKSKKRKKEKEHKDEDTAKRSKSVTDEDAVKHGGWWSAKTTAEIVGSVALEFGERCYLKALDNGYEHL